MRPVPRRREAVSNDEFSKWLALGLRAHAELADEAVSNAELSKWLEQLEVEHRDLDEVIHHLLRTRHHDSMRIQRLKKRKLKLKDMIAKVESELIPDLDA